MFFFLKRNIIYLFNTSECLVKKLFEGYELNYYVPHNFLLERNLNSIRGITE